MNMCWDVFHDTTLLSLCLWWTWRVGVYFITCECNSVWPTTWHCCHSVMGMMCWGVFHYLSATVCDPPHDTAFTLSVMDMTCWGVFHYPSTTVCDPPHDTAFTLSVMDICVGVYFITCECNSVWPATWHCFYSICNGHDVLGYISLPVSATVCDLPHDTAFTL